MQLLLIRHAHAVDAEENPLRPLSERGRAAARGLAQWLRPHLPEGLSGLLHSPLARAVETARLAGQAWGLTHLLRTAEHLLPEDAPELVLPLLRRRAGSLAIFGHNPHLSRLLALLLCADAECPLAELKKCGVAALRQRSRGSWELLWMVGPGQVLGGGQP